MQFTTIATLFTLALSVTAHPGRPPVDVHQQKNECGGGHLACCLEHSDIHADGFLSGLLTEGLLTPIIGSQEQSCAKFSLIENLNILGMFSYVEKCEFMVVANSVVKVLLRRVMTRLLASLLLLVALRARG